MKKFTFIMAMVLGFALNALALNPYAYAISGTKADNSLTVNYSLNADAVAAGVVFFVDGVATDTVALTDLTAGAHSATVTIPTLGKGIITWGVSVKGASPAAPTKETTTYQFWSPYGIAIDKNPESDYFGRLLITEAQGNVPDNYATGLEKNGLYAYNPDFTPIAGGAAFKGGLPFTSKMGNGTVNAYTPIRVRISEDGRIFASMQDSSFTAAVYELSQDLQTWTPVISGIKKGDGTLMTADSAFVAGLNCSMDLIGSGENLKLLLYSCNMAGVSFAQSGYRLDEYALGTATSFTGTPDHISLFDGNYGLVSAHTAVYYDGEGGYWFTANRGGNVGEPNLAHFNANGTRDYYSESSNFYGGAGLAIKDGNLYMGGNSGFIQVLHPAVGEDGNLTLTPVGDNITTGIGRNVNAIEFDFAGNMYACSNSGEKLAAFAMPYSGEVTTPAKAELGWKDLPETLYLVNAKGWGTPHAIFGSNDIVMTNTGEFVDGFKLYSVAVPADAETVKFTNGGSAQSDLFTIGGLTIFNYGDNTWYAATEDIVMHWFLKHNFGNGSDWTWKELTRDGEGAQTFSLRDIYGGNGCNWNGMADDKYNTWKAEPTLEGGVVAGDSAIFTLNPYTKAITITKIEEADPNCVTIDFTSNPLGLTEFLQVDSISVTTNGHVSFLALQAASTTVPRLDLDRFRMYGGSEIVLTTDLGCIASVQFIMNGTYDVTKVRNNGVALGEDGIWTPEVANRNKAVFTADAQVRIDKIIVCIDPEAVPVQPIIYYLAGSMNDWNPAGTQFAEDGTLTINLEAGNYEFKVTNGAWNDIELNYTHVDTECSSANVRAADGNNIHISLAEAGDVTIAVLGDSALCITGTFEAEDFVSVYSLVGDAGLGLTWTPADTDKDFTLADGVLTYEMKDVVLAAGDYKWKVVGDHSWAVQYPSNGDFHLIIAEDGTYDITFTLPLATGEGVAVATKHAETGLNDLNNAGFQKIIEDGVVYIIRDGVRYTTSGQIAR